MTNSTLTPVRSEVVCRAKDPSTCKYHGNLSRLNAAAVAGDFDSYTYLRGLVDEGRAEEVKAFQADVASEKGGLRGDKGVLNYLVREAERGMQAQNRELGDTPDGEDPWNEGYRAAYVVLATRLKADADAAKKPGVLAGRLSPKEAAVRAVELLKADRKSYFAEMPAAAAGSINPAYYREAYVEAVNDFIMTYDRRCLG